MLPKSRSTVPYEVAAALKLLSQAAKMLAPLQPGEGALPGGWLLGHAKENLIRAMHDLEEGIRQRQITCGSVRRASSSAEKERDNEP